MTSLLSNASILLVYNSSIRHHVSLKCFNELHKKTAGLKKLGRKELYSLSPFNNVVSTNESLNSHIPLNHFHLPMIELFFFYIKLHVVLYSYVKV